jgi:hypothetical protein
MRRYVLSRMAHEFRRGHGLNMLSQNELQPEQLLPRIPNPPVEK